MTDEFTKERIAEWRNDSGPWTDTDIRIAMDAIERRDQRIAELEGVPATEIETRDPDKLLAIIRGMDVECVGAMNEAKRAREERDAIRKALRCDPDSDAVSLAETLAKRAALCDAAEEERDAALSRVAALEELVCAAAPLAWAVTMDQDAAQAWERRTTEMVRAGTGETEKAPDRKT